MTKVTGVLALLFLGIATLLFAANAGAWWLPAASASPAGSPKNGHSGGASVQSEHTRDLAEPRADHPIASATQPVTLQEAGSKEEQQERAHLQVAPPEVQRVYLRVSQNEAKSYAKQVEAAAADSAKSIDAYVAFLLLQREVNMRELVIERLSLGEGILMVHGLPVEQSVLDKTAMRYLSVTTVGGQMADLLVIVDQDDRSLLDISASIFEMSMHELVLAVTRFNARSAPERHAALKNKRPEDPLGLPSNVLNSVSHLLVADRDSALLTIRQ